MDCGTPIETKQKKPKLIDLSNLHEPLGAALSSRELCNKCSLFEKCTEPFVMPWIPDGYTQKLLVVAPPPSESRDSVRPLKAKVGKFFRGIAERCGYGPKDVAFVSVTRCATENPSMDQIRCCRPFLLTTIERLKPANVLGLGKHALRSLGNTNTVNITKARGKQLEVPGL